MTDRRKEVRGRQPWQPHPDQVRECAAVWEFYSSKSPSHNMTEREEIALEDRIRRVLVAAKAWQERWDAEEARAKNAYVRSINPEWRS